MSIPDHLIKKASRLGAAAVPGAPVAGTAAGLVGGRALGRKAKEEKSRVKVWRGQGGAFVVVREPKTKQAFDIKMEAALRATGCDLDKVAEAYEAELEKIAFLGALARGAGSLVQRGSSALGAARAAGGGALQALKAAPGRAMEAVKAVPGNLQREFAAGRVSAQAAGRPKINMPAPPAAAPAVLPSPAPAVFPSPAPARVQMAGHTPGVTPGAAAGPAAGAAPAGVGPGAAAGPGLLQQAQQWATQRYNLGQLQGAPASTGNIGQWFGGLGGQQQAELAAALGAGALGTGFAAGTLTS